jgi:hypothetical protein
MTREELANAANEVVGIVTGRPGALSANHIGKLERGTISSPIPLYRWALRIVLDAESDDALGFATPKLPEAIISAEHLPQLSLYAPREKQITDPAEIRLVAAPGTTIIISVQDPCPEVSQETELAKEEPACVDLEADCCDEEDAA